MTLRHACFTSFADTLEIDETRVRYIIYQREKCPTTDKLHWQGYVELHKSSRIPGIQKAIGDPKAHIQKRRGTQQQAADYCRKDDTCVGERVEWGTLCTQGTRNDIAAAVDAIKQGSTVVDLISNNPHLLNYQRPLKEYKKDYDEKLAREQLAEEMDNVVLNPFQVEIMDRLSRQTDRQVLWVYDPEGNKGKSFLSKYLQAKEGAFRCENAPKKDIAYAYDKEPIFIMDLPRTSEERVNYEVIECMCNGQIFSPKYTSSVKVFIKPKILILANFAPDERALSADRWDIYVA